MKTATQKFDTVQFDWVDKPTCTLPREFAYGGKRVTFTGQHIIWPSQMIMKCIAVELFVLYTHNTVQGMLRHVIGPAHL